MLSLRYEINVYFYLLIAIIVTFTIIDTLNMKSFAAFGSVGIHAKSIKTQHIRFAFKLFIMNMLLPSIL